MSILQRKIVTIALVLLVFWLGHKSIGIRSQRAEVSSQVTDLESKVKDLERNNQFLASSSEYFGSAAYLERQARLKLNYKLPGEEVAFVYKDTSIKTPAPEEEFRSSLEQMPNWKKWWYYILGANL